MLGQLDLLEDLSGQGGLNFQFGLIILGEMINLQLGLISLGGEVINSCHPNLLATLGLLFSW